MATINFTNYADSVYGYNYGGINTFNLLKGEKTISTGATPAKSSTAATAPTPSTVTTATIR